MIEISHQQARRWLRLALDRPIDEAQWTALQAHLENCAQCRAYQEQRMGLERLIRRALRSRWSVPSGPLVDMTRRLMDARFQKTRRLYLLRNAGLALVCLLLIGLWWSNRRDAREQAGIEPTTAAMAAVSTPTASLRGAGAFQGVVAFDAASDGNEDIFLLEAGPNSVDISNLTENPARDSNPAWSPDGQWIAFLSDRERADGAQDIYVMSVAGTRLTRLTADQNLSWSAPLSWSPDGRWIAAVGTDVQRPLRWIYRISLSGRLPQPIPGTRGAAIPKFAPRQPLLAYIAQEGQLSFLRLYDGNTGLTYDLTRDEAERGSRVGPGGVAVSDFDWTESGSAILYRTLRSEPQRDPYAIDLHLVRFLQPGSSGVLLTGVDVTTDLLSSSSSVTPVLSAVLTPWNDLLYIFAYRRSGRWDACHPLTTPFQPPGSSVLPDRSSSLRLPQLCVLSPLDRSAWSWDMRWVILLGYSGQENGNVSTRGIYALKIPDRYDDQRAVVSERLADWPGDLGREGAKNTTKESDLVDSTVITGFVGTPQVRPVRAPLANPQPPMLSIDPLPAQPSAAYPAVVAPPANLLSSVMVTRAVTGGWSIARLTESGSTTPLEGGNRGYCLQFSPDGRRLAYVASGQDEDLLRSDIYVMDVDGLNPEKLTRLTEFPDPASPQVNRPVVSQYSCPSWSPDGSQLAAWVNAAGQTFLALVPTSKHGPGNMTRFYPLNSAGYRTPPVWTEDGLQVLVFLLPNGGREAELSAVRVADGAATRLSYPGGWETTSAAALSPDGRNIAYTAIHFMASTEVQTSVRVTALDTGETQPWITLPSYSTLSHAIGYDHLAWLPGSTSSAAPAHPQHAEPLLGIAFRGSPDGRMPSALLIYDPGLGNLTTLLSLEEDLVSAAWSPDGNWVLYSTASGLWLLNIDAALAGAAAPMWLGDTVAYEVVW